MARSGFDHLVAEVSVAVGAAIPRYRLWLRLHDFGVDPEALGHAEALGFCAGPLVPFLIDEGYWLSPRARRRLLRAVARFDPTRPSPADRLALSDL